MKTACAPDRVSVDADDVVVRLRHRLRSAELQPGERLGDERSLAAALGVTRHRMRAAIDTLEAEGRVRRRLGRGGGVFASDGRLERNLNTIEGLPVIAAVQGVELHTDVLRAELMTASTQDRRLLRLPPGANVYHLLRLRSADGRPLSLEETRMPAHLFPGLDRQDLGHLTRMIREVYGIAPHVADETVEVRLASADEAELLGVPEGAPLLRLARVTSDSRERPIEVATELFVADRLRLHLRRYGVVDHDRRLPGGG